MTDLLQKWCKIYWVKTGIYENALKHDEENRQSLFKKFQENIEK